MMGLLYTIIVMMRGLILIIGLIVSCVIGQGACPAGFPQITGPVMDINGQKLTGKVNVNGLNTSVVNGQAVGKNNHQFNLVSGVLSDPQGGGSTVCLAPGNYQVSIIPNGTNAVSSYSSIWRVPQSGGPYTVGQITDQTVVPYNPVVTSIVPGPANGYCITTLNGVTVWMSCGLSRFPVTVTASASVSVPATTHNLGSNVIVYCDGLAECGAVNVNALGDVLVTSSQPWTGTLYILSTPVNASVSFNSTRTVSLLVPFQPLSNVFASACYDAGGNQFGTAPFTVTEHEMGIGAATSGLPDIRFDLSDYVPVTGRCVVIGN